VLERTVQDYKSDEKPTWCPGCGDFGVLNAVYNTLVREGRNPEDIVCVSGIGCSSRLPFFMSTYGFHGVHGRAMPIATGVKTANPDLSVIVLSGDGDAFAIGGGHFLHAVRRNLDVTYVIMDNEIYGLTKGQASPTSATGFVTKTSPKGASEGPINPLAVALACGATFVARGFSAKPKELADLIVRGVQHKGLALIDVYSPCPTFNSVNTFKFFRENTADLPSSHDPQDKAAAMTMAMTDDPLYLGLFYQQTESRSFGANLAARAPERTVSAEKALSSLFDRFS
jgi:2-oxoglutarate ferredoxin oxidoreductase subunit beta